MKIVSNIVVPLFHGSGISTIIYPTKSPGDLTEYLRYKSSEILSYKVDAFVVVGGDGIMNEFVNGYVFGKYKSHKIAAILLNGGSGNSLCLTLRAVSILFLNVFILDNITKNERVQ